MQIFTVPLVLLKLIMKFSMKRKGGNSLCFEKTFKNYSIISTTRCSWESVRHGGSKCSFPMIISSLYLHIQGPLDTLGLWGFCVSV